MAYANEASQIKDIADVLIERVDDEIQDRRQRRENRKSLAQSRGWLYDARLDLAKMYLDYMNADLGKATQAVRVRSYPTKKQLKIIRNALIRANRRIRKLADPLPSSFTELDRLIERADFWIEQPSRPKHRVGYRQMEAVKLAALLLDITVGHPLTLTRGGQWHRLSAILFGDKKADLFNYMRRHKSSGGLGTYPF